MNMIEHFKLAYHTRPHVMFKPEQVVWTVDSHNMPVTLEFICEERHVVVREYYTETQLKIQAEFCNGVKNGFELVWYANGQLKKRCNWLNGKEHGIIEEYYDNGQLHNIFECSHGIRNGRQKVYSINGDLVHSAQVIEGNIFVY